MALAGDDAGDLDDGDLGGGVVVLGDDFLQPRAGRADMGDLYGAETTQQTPEVEEHADPQQQQQHQGKNHPATATPAAGVLTTAAQ